MDPNSKNIFDIWKGITTLAINGEKELNNTIQVSYTFYFINLIHLF